MADRAGPSHQPEADGDDLEFDEANAVVDDMDEDTQELASVHSDDDEEAVSTRALRVVLHLLYVVLVRPPPVARSQLLTPRAPQGLTSPAKKELARQEKERLRQMEKKRKEHVERMQAEANELAAQGTVRPATRLRCLALRTTAAGQLITLPLPPTPTQEGREKSRLQFLLKQAEIFQHFGGGNAAKDGKE